MCKYKSKTKRLRRWEPLLPMGSLDHLILCIWYIHTAPKFLQGYTLQKQKLMKLVCVIINMTSFSHFRFKCISTFDEREVVCLANEFAAMFGDLLFSGVELGAFSLKKLTPKPSFEE